VQQEYNPIQELVVESKSPIEVKYDAQTTTLLLRVMVARVPSIRGGERILVRTVLDIVRGGDFAIMRVWELPVLL
jgi:hypothetical protein